MLHKNESKLAQPRIRGFIFQQRKETGPRPEILAAVAAIDQHATVAQPLLDNGLHMAPHHSSSDCPPTITRVEKYMSLQTYLRHDSLLF
mmetsp:Transcript_13706/g.28308  ORF Transcript_13706/g.28308 Transcript_13706/m.28308 type:complete len:89 (-) Transcript_13706:73-339(-)